MRCVVALFGLAIGVGCRNAAPPGAGSGSGASTEGSSSEPIAEPMATPGSAAPPEPGRVTLPRTPNTPPHRTTRPLGRKELERLTALEFDTFEREDRGTRDGFAEVRYNTRTRPILGVTITIEPCPPARPTKPKAASAGPACTPMELAAWQARTDELKQFLSKDLAARPDTRFEVGTRDVLGTPAIYTYQLAAFFGKDERDNPVGAYSDAYILYYNDGVNQIRVNASYLDDAVGGIDKLVAIAPEEDLEKLAVAFMSFYLHAWK